jgi:hypothetical protein
MTNVRTHRTSLQSIEETIEERHGYHISIINRYYMLADSLFFTLLIITTVIASFNTTLTIGSAIVACELTLSVFLWDLRRDQPRFWPSIKARKNLLQQLVALYQDVGDAYNTSFEDDASAQAAQLQHFQERCDTICYSTYSRA